MSDANTKPRPKRDYLNSYPCFVCARKVKVYDWLPVVVLCPRCDKEADEIEAICAEDPTFFGRK